MAASYAGGGYDLPGTASTMATSATTSLRRTALALAVSCFTLPCVGQDRTIHVALHGDDGQPGTAARPMGTIHAALERARQQAPSAPADMVIVVHRGTHRIVRPLTVGPEHIPANGGLRLVAANGSAPVISGGRLVSGFEKLPNGDLHLHLPGVAGRADPPRELFVNGSRRPRARHPNQGWSRVERPATDKRTGFIFRPDGLPAAARGPGMELLFLHDWSTSRVPVKDIDHERHSLTVAHPIGPKANHYRIDNFEKHPRFRLENHRALLDAPGEWFLETGTAGLTYRPLKKESPDSLRAVFPVTPQLLVVRGTPTKPVKDVLISGLTFAHTAFALPPRGYAAGQATFHEDRVTGEGNETRTRVPAAISFVMAQDCTVRDCRVTQLGTSGIAFGSRTRNCVLHGTVVEDVAGNGVILGEDTERQVEDAPWWKAAPTQAARGHEVSNCVIQDCGRVFPGAVGIWVGLARGLRVEHNLLRRLPYTGISVGWLWSAVPSPCKENRIERNHIHHVMQVLSDGGGIYTIGRQPGTLLRGNHIHDVPLNMGRAGSNGMFLDQGTADLTITGNLIHGIAKSPLRFHLATSALVTANIMAPGSGVPLVAYNSTPKTAVTLKDNTTLALDALDLSTPAAAAIADRAGLQADHRHLAPDRPPPSAEKALEIDIRQAQRHPLARHGHRIRWPESDRVVAGAGDDAVPFRTEDRAQHGPFVQPQDQVLATRTDVPDPGGPVLGCGRHHRAIRRERDVDHMPLMPPEHVQTIAGRGVPQAHSVIEGSRRQHRSIRRCRRPEDRPGVSMEDPGFPRLSVPDASRLIVGGRHQSAPAQPEREERPRSMATKLALECPRLRVVNADHPVHAGGGDPRATEPACGEDRAGVSSQVNGLTRDRIQDRGFARSGGAGHVPARWVEAHRRHVRLHSVHVKPW